MMAKKINKKTKLNAITFRTDTALLQAGCAQRQRALCRKREEAVTSLRDVGQCLGKLWKFSDPCIGSLLIHMFIIEI